MEVTEKKLENDLIKLKNFARTAINKKRYDDSLILIKTAAKLAYNLPFNYSDDDLEKLLSQAIDQCLIFNNFAPIKNKFVFYDSFSIDNRGLSQQYIRALISWNVDFLYIFDCSEKNEIGFDINLELLNHPKAEIFYPAFHFSEIEKAQEIIQKIESYKPQYAFLHFAPWSVTGVGIWNKLNAVKRYFIDLTDHTFWLGKNSADYFIEFRNYGYTIAKNYRKINPNQLLRQQYYPISSNHKFNGFPEITQNKIKIFCGANYYKMYGRKGIFLDILKNVANSNTNSIILIAGSGQVRPLKEFITKHGLHDQIILLGDRIDIEEVFKNVDIYLGTYPIGGGLMVQYALKNLVPTIAYTTHDLLLTDVTGLYRGKEIKNIQYYDLPSFYNRINSLVNQPELRNELSHALKGSIITPQEFSTELLQLINSNNSPMQEEVVIDNNSVGNLYLETENDWLKQYEFIKLSELKLIYLKYDFWGAVLSFAILIIKHPSVIVRKIMNLFYFNSSR